MDIATIKRPSTAFNETTAVISMICYILGSLSRRLDIELLGTIVQVVLLLNIVAIVVVLWRIWRDESGLPRKRTLIGRCVLRLICSAGVLYMLHTLWTVG